MNVWRGQVIAGVLIVMGALIIYLAIWATRKLISTIENDKYRVEWRRLYLLMSFFLL